MLPECVNEIIMSTTVHALLTARCKLPLVINFICVWCGSKWVKLFIKLSQVLQDVESQYHRVSTIILKNSKLVTIAWNLCHLKKVMNVSNCFQCLFTVYHFGSFICITTSIKVRRKYCSQMDGRSCTKSLPLISHWGRLYHMHLNASEFQLNVIVLSFVVCSVILEFNTLFQTWESLGLG